MRAPATAARASRAPAAQLGGLQAVCIWSGRTALAAPGAGALRRRVAGRGCYWMRGRLRFRRTTVEGSTLHGPEHAARTGRTRATPVQTILPTTGLACEPGENNLGRMIAGHRMRNRPQLPEHAAVQLVRFRVFLMPAAIRSCAPATAHPLIARMRLHPLLAPVPAVVMGALVMQHADVPSEAWGYERRGDRSRSRARSGVALWCCAGDRSHRHGCGQHRAHSSGLDWRSSHRRSFTAAWRVCIDGLRSVPYGCTSPLSSFRRSSLHSRGSTACTRPWKL